MSERANPVRPKLTHGALPFAKQQLGIVMALLLLLIVSSFLSPRFLSLPNLLNVLRQVAIVGILAIGQTFVILTAGIDLSVGAILGLCVVLFADILQALTHDAQLLAAEQHALDRGERSSDVSALRAQVGQEETRGG